jgi:spermidine/putrescine transport system ATP-binding protein/putrescine transport system ATP-binding protein
MTPVLQIVNIVKQFGTTTAVEDVSLDIAGNEFFALLGASGSGKTTLLRMLAGFETPTRGQILLDGADVSRVPPDKRPVNLMFQSYALFPHMTVRANISYGLEMERLARSEITARVDDILDVIQLTPFADRKPDQLSGGQKQRVALARALVKRPRVLLLDEPLGALDKKLRSAMQLELKRLQLEVGITFVIVTHDQEEALVMADRIAILKDGKLLQCGAPRDVYEHPVNRFAADFIGVMNFFPGQAAPGGVRLSDGSLIATDTGLQAGPALAAIRPERIRLAPGENTLSGTVRALAYHGLDLQLHVETPLSPKPVTVRLTADLAEAQSLEPGATVTLGWATKDTRIFPA